MIEYKLENTKNDLLKPYIENYARLKLSDNSIQAKELLPWPGTSLLFVNQPFQIDNENFQSSCIVGIREEASILKWNTSCLESFSVKFTPFGLSRFTDIPINHFKNQTIDSKEVWNKNDRTQLTTLLFENLDWQERIAFIENFLVRSFNKITSVETNIFHLAHQFKLAPSSNIDELRKNIPLSTRQLERKFNQLIGVNLQTFIRICRFDHAKKLLLQGKADKLTSLGYDTGYFDQSHFSREFKKMALTSPKHFLKTSPFYNLMAANNYY